MSPETQTNIIKALIFLACVNNAIQTWQFSQVINTPRFSNFVWKMFIFFIGFAIVRCIAFFLDNWLDLDIGWFSAASMVALLTFPGWFIRRQRKVIESAERNSTGGLRLSEIVAEGFEEIKAIRERFNALQKAQ